MVISVAVFGLLSLLNPFSHFMRGTEIKRCALNLVDGAQRYSCVINRDIVVGIDCHVIVQDGERILFHAVQGEICMIGKAYDGLPVSGSLIFNDQFIVIGQTIGNVDVQIAGEALLAILAQIMQMQCLSISLLGVEYAFVETGGTAMKAVGVIVDGQ